MGKWIVIIGIFFLSGMDAVFAQFNEANSKSLFSDVKAAREGDVIMVLIVEDTKADNAATSTENKDSELSGGVSAGADGNNFNASAGLNTGNKFSGSGSTARKESIRSKISVRVTGLDEFGNLLIEGTRVTVLNGSAFDETGQPEGGEKQTIRLTGTIRPVDILSNNTVYSYNILDLRLYIIGEGKVTDVQEPGLITKLLRFLF
jgi:flagellar L-ring protein precursor FlgH